MKKKTNDELKVVSTMKRICSDINQLYGELSNELSEEYLNDDNAHIASSIKDALEIINGLRDGFLVESKTAINTLIKSDNAVKESIIESISSSKEPPIDEVVEHLIPNNKLP